MLFDYIFGKGVNKVLPLDRLEITVKEKNSKLKNIKLDNILVATIRYDGSIALTCYGAKLLSKSHSYIKNCVTIKSEAEDYVAKGYSVFAKHVIRCGDRVRPRSDVTIINSQGEVIAVGRAILSAKMMMEFKSGMAVKVREGINKSLGR